MYNAEFDRQFLDFAARSIACCMLRYAEHAGEWSEYFGNWRWQRLSAAAGETGFVWPKSGARRGGCPSVPPRLDMGGTTYPADLTRRAWRERRQ